MPDQRPHSTESEAKKAKYPPMRCNSDFTPSLALAMAKCKNSKTRSLSPQVTFDMHLNREWQPHTPDTNRRLVPNKQLKVNRHPKAQIPSLWRLNRPHTQKSATNHTQSKSDSALVNPGFALPTKNQPKQKAQKRDLANTTPESNFSLLEVTALPCPTRKTLPWVVRKTDNPKHFSAGLPEPPPRRWKTWKHTHHNCCTHEKDKWLQESHVSRKKARHTNTPEQRTYLPGTKAPS